MSRIDYDAFLARLKGEHADTPPVPNGAQLATYAETPVAPADTEKHAGQFTVDKSALATKLENVSEKAINKLDEIIDLPLDPGSAQFSGVLRAQNAAANTALTTQVKVDETGLRRRSLDRLPDILKLVNEMQARLPPRDPDRGENDL